MEYLQSMTVAVADYTAAPDLPPEHALDEMQPLTLENKTVSKK